MRSSSGEVGSVTYQANDNLIVSAGPQETLHAVNHYSSRKINQSVPAD